MEGNLAYRLELQERANNNEPGVREGILEAAKNDILWFLNAICWLHETRKRYDSKGRRLPTQIPFITWPHQDPAILAIRESLGVCDIGVEKSRAEGMSWIMVLMALHDWLFEEGIEIGLVSSTEDKSDTPNKVGSLLGKLDWELARIPQWMVGPKMKSGVKREDAGWIRNVKDHTFTNLQRGNIISGYAATGDVGRGERFLWFGFDEIAANDWQMGGNDYRAVESTRDTTDSRLLISTPNGRHGAYYESLTTDSNIAKVRISWKDNTSKNRGLYRFVRDKIVAVDPVNNPLPLDYWPSCSTEVLNRFARLRRKGYDLHKGERSPWYDRECDRPLATPQSVAKELDMDYGGTMRHVFPATVMEIAEGTVEEPYSRGEVSILDNGKFDFTYDTVGRLHLWETLDAHRRPPAGPYTIACDVAQGGGGGHSTNSVMTVVNNITREQAAEFATNTMQPEEFCNLVLGCCEWFNNAFLIWEHMGPGTAFGSRVLDAGYTHYYMRAVKWKVRGRGKRRAAPTAPGWVHSGSKSGDDKERICADLRAAIREGEIILRSKSLVNELSHYTYDEERQHIKHSLVKTGSEVSHGDRVIAIALALQAMKTRPLPPIKVPKPFQWDFRNPPPYGTPAHRLWEAEMELKADRDDWDHRSTSDLSGRRNLQSWKTS